MFHHCAEPYNWVQTIWFDRLFDFGETFISCVFGCVKQGKLSKGGKSTNMLLWAPAGGPRALVGWALVGRALTAPKKNP